MSTSASDDAIRSFSVVVFTYNYSRFLARCLEGIAAQTRRPDRVLVCDDCSPIDSEEELRAIMAPYPWAELRRNPSNIGAVANYRQGLASVTEDAYMLHSADDELADPNFFADALALLEQEPDLVAVFGHKVHVDVEGRRLSADPPPSDRPWTRLERTALRRRLAYDNVVPAVCTVIRSAVHERLPPFPIDSSYRHDWQQWYLFTFHGDFGRIERPVMHYRVHGANISVGHAQSERLASTLDKDYHDLMARPELDDDDRRHLQHGLDRLLIRTTRVGRLPAIAWCLRRSPALTDALLETVIERTADRLQQAARAFSAASLARRTGERRGS